MSDQSQEQTSVEEFGQDLNSMYTAIDAAINDSLGEVDNDKSQEDNTQNKTTSQADPNSSEDDASNKTGGDGTKSQEADKTNTISAEEQKARTAGWRPKDEWEGDPSQWISSGEFNRRTELFDKIGSQNRQIKTLHKKLDALINHNQSLEEKTRAKVIAELEEKRKEAVKYGDEQTFTELDKKLNEVKEEKSTFTEDQTKEKEVEIPQPVKDFAERNSAWFEKDRELTDFSVFKTQRLVGSGVSLPEALKTVEKELLKVFPHKFKNKNKDKPSSVLPGNNKEAQKTGLKISNLTDEQKDVWNILKSYMKPEDFLKQLGDMK